jgi:hypothetical protein
MDNVDEEMDGEVGLKGTVFDTLYQVLHHSHDLIVGEQEDELREHH